MHDIAHDYARAALISDNVHAMQCVQFGALGVACAGAAVALYEGVRVSEIVLRPLPRHISAPLAGGVCGMIALVFPQASAAPCLCCNTPQLSFRKRRNN